MCNSRKTVFAIAYAQCLLEGKNPAEFIHPRKHLAQYLPTGSLPNFPKVLAEHLPVVLHKEVHISLKPVEKSLFNYDEDILMKTCSKYNFTVL